MQLNCRECGALNDTGDPPGECDICGSRLVADSEPVLAKVSLVQVRKRRSEVRGTALGHPGLGASITPLGDRSISGRALDSEPPGGVLPPSRPPGSRPPSSVPPPSGPPPSMPPASIDDLFGALGADLASEPPPAVDALGLDALVGPPPAGGAEPMAFTFGESGAVAAPPDTGTDLFGSLSADADDFAVDDPATRVVDIESNMPDAARPQPAGWKVRSERGVVYELMTVEAVVAWLDGKTDLSGVRVAKGQGAFQDVVAFPELTGRLPDLKRAEQPAPNEPAPAADELSLDIDPDRARQQRDRRLKASRSPAPREAGGITRNAPAKRPRESVAAPKRPDNPVGFGLVMWSLIAAGVLATVTAFVGHKMGWVESPAVVGVATDTSMEPDEDLADAIELYEAGKFAAAQARLRRLAKTAEDPRVHRYLALTYYRTNRQPEARAALEEYRRGMLKRSGEHGRQVREVRD